MIDLILTQATDPAEELRLRKLHKGRLHMAPESAEEDKKKAEQAVQALYDFLRQYCFSHRVPWMHDLLGTDFHQGEAHALSGLALIPELRTALDAIDEQLGREQLGRDLEQWHGAFKPKASQ